MLISTKGGVDIYVDELGYLIEGDIECLGDVKASDLTQGFREKKNLYRRHLYKPKMSIFFRTPLCRVKVGVPCLH